MGRPLNKRNFENGDGSQLKIRAKIGTNAEGDGFIVKQVGETRYRVTVGANTGVVMLVDKDSGSLLAGEGTITFEDVDSNLKRVKKLLSHRAVFFDGETSGWSFEPAVDGIWQAADVEDGYVEITYTITIDEQPVPTSALEGDTATFSIAASVVPDAQISYQWQMGGEGYSDIEEGGGFSGTTTDTLTIDPVVTEINGTYFQCVAYINDREVDGVTSSPAEFTLAP